MVGITFMVFITFMGDTNMTRVKFYTRYFLKAESNKEFKMDIS